ncbi:DUF4377 domain-containing protein, partial [Tenacibaculum sp.]|nr:DUF4377 domain-containing protein [Tenacibaculum sp.]
FLVSFSCSSSDDDNFEKKITVASEQGNCVRLASQNCLLIKQEKQQNWEFFYETITGFTYEEGFEYELLVSQKRIPPAEGRSSIKTSLIKILSKNKKDSQGLTILCNNITNPLENLLWLKELKTSFEISNSAVKRKIIQYTYKKNTVFFINECVDCPDNLIRVYNCKKENVCDFGGISGINTCPDFQKESTNKTILWEN